MRWIRDEEFARGTVPMSKFDIRVIALALLDISAEDIFLDIGAGTGSLSVQASLLGAEVYAVEKEPEGVELIRKNAIKLGAEISIIQGTAPEALDSVKSFNKCFIGGSGGKLIQIVDETDKKLSSGGILAASFIVPDNMVELRRILMEKKYSGIEAKLIQSSIIEGTGLMKANNPIFLIRGKKP
ncbi:MAG TPA: precorrin-6Y C5,15-methyltransferase (decarboxylating) subunit CbiT [Clostridia bacterium]|nr:precorrin-6Y C5,15-methyltransferase (decarboxylating) subunit CbiT [Clostridia bacterium]